MLCFILAGAAGHTLRWQGHHGCFEFIYKLVAATYGAGQGGCSFHALKATPLGWCIPLLQLGTWEFVLDLGNFADAALQIGRAARVLALPRGLGVLCVDASQAGGRQVGADLLPLCIGESVHDFDVPAFLAGRRRSPGFVIFLPVDFFTTQALQQELRSFWGAALKEPKREGSHDEDIVPAAHAAHCHRAQGGVCPLVDGEV